MSEYELIPEGTYAATVAGSQLGMTSTGKMQICVTFDVHVDPSEMARTMTWFGFFTDAAAERTIEALGYLGFDAAERDLNELDPLDPWDSPIVGAECDVVVKHEEYNGVLRDKIAFVNRRGGKSKAFRVSEDRKLSAGDRAMLAAQIRAKAQASKAKGGGFQRPATQTQRPAAPAQQTRSTPAAPPPIGGINYDDIPF